MTTPATPTVPAYATTLVADTKADLKSGLDAIKTLLDGILAKQETTLPVITEDVKNTAVGALDASLTGFTKELLDTVLSVGGSAALEAMVQKADPIELGQLTMLSNVVDAHLAAWGA